MNEQESPKPAPDGAPPASSDPRRRSPWKQPTLVDYGSIRHLVRATSGPLGDTGSGGVGMRMLMG